MDFYVDNNCVYNGLRYNLINKDDLFSYLCQYPKSINSLIAYRQSCMFSIDENEKLFDTLNSKDALPYIYIYILSKGKPLNVKIDEGSINNFLYVESTIKSLTNANTKDKFLCIAGMNDVVKNSYNFKHFVATDRLENLKINSEKDLDIVLDRLEKIKENYNYFLMLRPLYGDILYTSDIDKYITINNIERIKEFFTKSHNIIPEKIFNLSKYSIDVFKKAKIVQLYLLGIEFFFNGINDSNIDERINILSEDPNKLIELIHQHPVYSSVTINETDTLSENWKKYLPYDIFIYNEGTHKYAFTRPEFHWIILNKKNPWNNKEIDESIIKYIEFLITFSSENKFPKSKTMPDAWENMEDEKVDLKDIIMRALGLPENLIYHLVI
jgi:hypothetical protein